jgi:hypothetical protein
MSGENISGWFEVPTDLVTAENVADFMPRESDAQVQRDFYAAYIAENFADIATAARPYSDLSGGGDMASPEATPAG